MAFDYDLFVIGGGSGGVRAARVAAQTGAKVALAEDDRYGGTCVIRGCVPKKFMVFASEYPAMIADAKEYGWAVNAGGFNWDSFKTKLHTELDRLEGVYRKILSSNGVTTYDARATIADPHTVTLSTGESFSTKHILVATGGSPVRPSLPGSEHGLVSDDMFHFDTLPKSMLIIGGGYIACEFAGIMNGLGVEICQFYRGAQILRGFDEEARGLVSEEMIQNGIDLRLGTNIIEMEPVEGGYRIKATNGQERVFEQVMFATGRRPNTADMGLEEVGVKLGRGGQIIVDEYSQTDVPSIYAIGEVTDRVNLTPVASR